MPAFIWSHRKCVLFYYSQFVNSKRITCTWISKLLKVNETRLTNRQCRINFVVYKISSISIGARWSDKHYTVIYRQSSPNMMPVHAGRVQCISIETGTFDGHKPNAASVHSVAVLTGLPTNRSWWANRINAPSCIIYEFIYTIIGPTRWQCFQRLFKIQLISNKMIC